jgi:hypothetical protein
MNLKFRLFIYAAVLSVPLLSLAIYGGWWEVRPFVILVVLLAVAIEFIYHIQKTK